jgi:F0F1-type ATP synthase membrane subunit b/b'
MGQRTKEAWNEVEERFASWGRRLSDHYQEAGSGESAEEAQRKLQEAARQIGNELDRVFSALDGTLRDPQAKGDLKDAVGAIGSAVSATIDEAAAAVRRRGGSGEKGEPPERPDEGEPPTTT